MEKQKIKNENLIKNTDSIFRYYLDLIIMMLPLLIMGGYLNGYHAIRLPFVAILSAVICEFISCKVMKSDNTLSDLSAVATALAISLMLPATCPAYIAAAGSVFAILVAKVPFGGTKHAPFLPAAAGFAFLCVCFPSEVFTYPSVETAYNSALSTAEGFVRGTSFGEMLSYGKSIDLNALEIIPILVGKTAGPMGTTCVLALLGIAVYLLAKRRKKFYVSISFILTCAVMAMLFPRVNSGIFTSVVMELSAGTLLFVGLVLIHDPVTAPNRAPYSILYGICAGVICMLLRYFARYPEGACFSILIMNAITPVAKDYVKMIKKELRKKKKAQLSLSKGKAGNGNG